MLVPGASRSTVVLTGSMSSFANAENRVKATYKKKRILRDWPKVKEDFVLDYYSFAGSVYLKSDTHRAAIALEKIAKETELANARMAGEEG